MPAMDAAVQDSQHCAQTHCPNTDREVRDVILVMCPRPVGTVTMLDAWAIVVKYSTPVPSPVYMMPEPRSAAVPAVASAELGYHSCY